MELNSLLHAGKLGADVIVLGRIRLLLHLLEVQQGQRAGLVLLVRQGQGNFHGSAGLAELHFLLAVVGLVGQSVLHVPEGRQSGLCVLVYRLALHGLGGLDVREALPAVKQRLGETASRAEDGVS